MNILLHVSNDKLLISYFILSNIRNKKLFSVEFLHFALFEFFAKLFVELESVTVPDMHFQIMLQYESGSANRADLVLWRIF